VDARFASEGQDLWPDETRPVPPINRGEVIGRMDEPILADARPLVDSPLFEVVPGGGLRGENFDHEIRATTDATSIELLRIANDEDVGLYDCVRVVVVLSFFWQAHVDGCNEGTTGFSLK